MIKKALGDFEKIMARYRLTIGVIVFVMLITLSILTWTFFDKQNQIIETGGFVDGKVKCVCSQEAWDQFEESLELNPLGLEINSNITLDG